MKETPLHNVREGEVVWVGTSPASTFRIRIQKKQRSGVYSFTTLDEKEDWNGLLRWVDRSTELEVVSTGYTRKVKVFRDA